MLVVKKLPGSFVVFFLLAIITVVAAAVLIVPNHQDEPAPTPPISAHFEDRTAHAQVEVDEALFAEIINQVYRDGALLYLDDDAREKKVVYPHRFSLILVDDPLPLIQTYDGDSGELVFSLAQTYEDDHLTLYLQQHPNIYQQIKKHQDHQRLFGVFVKALWLTSPFVSTLSGVSEREGIQLFEEQCLYQNHSWLDRIQLKLQHRPTQQVIKQISHLIRQTFRAQVFAASCVNNSVMCGMCTNQCTCVGDTGFCNNDGDPCGYAGTCSCSYRKKCDPATDQLGGCTGSPPSCSQTCGTCPQDNSISLHCSGSCSCSGCESWGEFGDCNNSCGEGLQYRYQTCYYSSCSTYANSDSKACCTCADTCTCTLCGASCGTDYCGDKAVDGQRCCGEDCAATCRFDCPCRTCNIGTLTLTNPANAATFSNVPYVDLSWTLGSWGARCPDNRYYSVCVGSSAGSCNLVNNVNNGENSSYRFQTNGDDITSVLPGDYFWQITATNRDQNTSANRYFTVEQNDKACTVTIPSPEDWESYDPANPTVNVNLWGNAQASYGNDVRLFVERVDGTQLPTNNISPAANHDGGIINYYHISDITCLSSMEGGCTTSSSVSLPTMGNYFFHCDIPDSPKRCTGNPFCTHEVDTMYGQDKPAPPYNSMAAAIECDNWESCYDPVPNADNLTTNDNVYYCAGAGEPTIEITSPFSDTEDPIVVDMTDNSSDTINITWDSPNRKANSYNVRIYRSDAYSNPDEVDCNDGVSICDDNTASYPWSGEGPSAAWGAGGNLFITKGDWYWLYDIQGQTFLDGGVARRLSEAWLAKDIKPTTSGTYPWDGAGLSAAWTSVFNSQEYVAIIKGDWYWTYDVSGQMFLNNGSPQRLSSVWLERGLQAAPDGTYPWDGDGPSAAWVARGNLFVAKNDWYWHYDIQGQTFFDGGVARRLSETWLNATPYNPDCHTAGRCAWDGATAAWIGQSGRLNILNDGWLHVWSSDLQQWESGSPIFSPINLSNHPRWSEVGNYQLFNTDCHTAGRCAWDGATAAWLASDGKLRILNGEWMFVWNNDTLRWEGDSPRYLPDMAWWTEPSTPEQNIYNTDCTTADSCAWDGATAAWIGQSGRLNILNNSWLHIWGDGVWQSGSPVNSPVSLPNHPRFSEVGDYQQYNTDCHTAGRCSWNGATAAWVGQSNRLNFINGDWLHVWNISDSKWDSGSPIFSPKYLPDDPRWTEGVGIKPASGGIYPWSTSGPSAAWTAVFDSKEYVAIIKGDWYWTYGVDEQLFLNNGNPQRLSSVWLNRGIQPTNEGYTFSPPDDPNNPHQVYTVAVKATNNTCSPYLPDSISDWVTADFQLKGYVTGSLIDDSSDEALLLGLGPLCTLEGASQFGNLSSYFSSLNINSDLNYSVALNQTSDDGEIGDNGSYSIFLPYRNQGWTQLPKHRLTLNAEIDIDSVPQEDWRFCSTCHNENHLSNNTFSCTYSGIVSPMTDVNYYLQGIDVSNSAWFQAIGGNIIAQESISSFIPYDTAGGGPCFAESFCIPALITNKPWSLNNPVLNSPGFPLAANNVNTHEEGSNITEFVHLSNTRNQSNDGHATNNSFFIREHSFASLFENFGQDTTQLDNAQMPNNIADGLNLYLYSDPNNPLTISDSTPWEIDYGEQVIVFVEGNLEFQDGRLSTETPLTQVEPGGFLAFIVSGDIIVDESVGSAFNFDDLPGAFALPDNTTHLEGVFLADGFLIVESNNSDMLPDKKFIGAGTFVGWSGVELNRDFDDSHFGRAWHNYNPTETFIYRPDFLVNIPSVMTEPLYEWREVAPRRILSE